MTTAKITPFNRFVGIAVSIVGLFLIVVNIIPLATFIVLMNGVLAGAMVSIGVAYWRLIKGAIIGIYPYTDVRQMTLAFLLLWVCIGCSVAASLQLRTTGAVIHPTMFVAVSRYVAVVAAILFVTAPDFGLGLFHGRDRKVLWTSAITGTVVATVLIYLQVSESFAA